MRRNLPALQAGPRSEMAGRIQFLKAGCVFAAALCGVVFAAGCDVGPKYAKPSAQTPVAYKELTPENYKETDGWKVATPKDDALRGAWWQIFGDAKLNELEEQVNISNQNVAAAASQFLAARALVREARSQYYPTVGVNPSISYDRVPFGTIGGTTSSSGTGTGSGSSSTSSTSFISGTFAEYALTFDASWQPDLWGRVKNMVRSNVYEAQASAADLENVRLTIEAQLAENYFELRSQDALKDLFDQTIVSYQDSLKLEQDLYQAGLATSEAVAQAETQLDETQAQDTNLGILRAQYEHAIAMLVGQPASTFSIAVAPFNANPPAIPIGVPADLLERRPDIAANERLMAQANVQIGVAKAAYYPNVTLSAAAGLENISITSWFTWPSRFWALGPSLAETIFDAGLRNATMQQYQAMYDQTIANYRESVLTAFEQVEDSLAALRILSRELAQQDAAVQAADKSLQAASSLYKAGIDPYLDVITAQTALLSNRQTAVAIRSQQMTASVQLIEALGGGWDAKLPAPDSMKTKNPPTGPGTPQPNPNQNQK
jgi:NodT family efflux transporter outer membrane factor (OMF) lipoprotein